MIERSTSEALRCSSSATDYRLEVALSYCLQPTEPSPHQS